MNRSPDYYFNKGLSLHSISKIEESIEYYNEAIKLDSKNSDFYCNIGLSLKS